MKTTYNTPTTISPARTAAQFGEIRTYLYAALFVVGNILLPRLCHAFDLGGLTWLPIYFFTLIGAYRYGWRVGVLTALASPMVSASLFGMPSGPMLAVVIAKSLILAIAASTAANRLRCNIFLAIAAVILAYQSLGFLAEWAILGNIATAVAHLRICIPGLIAQLILAPIVLSRLH